MRRLVLDTGALVALQRDRVKLRGLLQISADLGYDLRTTAPVITEFLGGSSPSLRGAAEYVCSRLRVAPVDEALARRAAALMQAAIAAAPRVRPSPVDALVAAEAERAEAEILLDGDQKDFEALSEWSDRIELIALNELSE